MPRCISKLETDIAEARPRLKIYAKKLTRNTDEAEDLLQETLLRACCHYDRHDPRYKFLTWAQFIMRNLFLNRLKASARQQHLLLEDLRSDAPQEQDKLLFLRASHDVAEECETREMLRSAMDVIYALDEQQRALIMDDISEQYSYRELAEKHKIPLGTVKTYLFRIRKHVVKKMYGKQWMD